MPYISADGDFDRVFMTSTEFVDQFVGSSAWSWGSNGYGQLGDGTTTSRSSPGIVAGGGVNWKQLESGDQSAAGIKTDGTLWTWGRDSYGVLGSGTTANRSSPATIVGGGTTWRSVEMGLNCAAIKTDGTLWTWGYNGFGGLGDGTTSNRSSPVTTLGGGTNWKQVSGGNYAHMAAIKTDGTLWIWGSNTYGQLGDGTTSNRSSPVTTLGGGTNWKQVALGHDDTAAIKTDGTLWTWGYNANGQLGNATTTSRRSPGTVAGGGTNWKQVVGATQNYCAIKTDGTLWTWGNNSNGQLGDGTISNRSSPVTTAGGGTNWKQVSCGYKCVLAIKTDGTLWSWGYNNTGKLGNGTTTDQSSPIQPINNLSNWKQVSCGYNFTTAVAQN